MAVTANTAYATFSTVVPFGSQGDLTKEFTQILNILPGDSETQYPDTYGAARVAPGPPHHEGSGALWLRGGSNVEVYHHMPVPHGATSLSDFILRVNRAVTNPGDHFFDSQGPNPEPVKQSDESHLCRLQIGVPGESAFDGKLQPNTADTDSLEFAVKATQGSNQEGFLDIKITWSCPDDAELMADIMLYELLLEYEGRPTATSSIPLPTVTPTGRPIPRPNDDCTICLKGWCEWDITILKPAPCTACNDGGLYYEFIEIEKIWRPIRCVDDSCSEKKNLCKPEKCSGGFCGEYEIVEEDHCDCEGGFEYKKWEYVVGSSVSTGGKVTGDDKVIVTGGGVSTGGKTVTSGCNGADCAVEYDSKTSCTGHGCGNDNGFVVVAGSTSNVVGLVAMLAGLLPFGLMQLL